jgi:hypothetical protein
MPREIRGQVIVVEHEGRQADYVHAMYVDNHPPLLPSLLLPSHKCRYLSVSALRNAKWYSSLYLPIVLRSQKGLSR